MIMALLPHFPVQAKNRQAIIKFREELYKKMGLQGI
jgi:hypothetical protein